jgi:hypothetical protein
MKTNTVFSLSILTAIMTVSANAFAFPVSAEKVREYKQFVNAALDQNLLNCTFTPSSSNFPGGSLESGIDQTSDVDNALEAQHELDFYSYEPLRVFFNVTTSADYKSVTSVYFGKVDCTDVVNLGDYSVQDSCKTTITAFCK